MTRTGVDFAHGPPTRAWTSQPFSKKPRLLERSSVRTCIKKGGGVLLVFILRESRRVLLGTTGTFRYVLSSQVRYLSRKHHFLHHFLVSHLFLDQEEPGEAWS